MPDIRNKVLFPEDDNIMGDYFCYEFDRAEIFIVNH